MPVTGPTLRAFAPIGSYGGHWGVDIAAAEGSSVGAADRGYVTFAGSVAGMLTVTIAHGGGLRTSYSYLDGVTVVPGEHVDRLTVIGASGVDHGLEALHFSVRVGDRYHDPAGWLGCFDAPHSGLRLVPVPAVHGPGAYPSRRATRHPRRYVRSTPSGPPLSWRGGISRPGARHSHLHSRRGSLAEGGPQNHRSGGPVADDPAGDRRCPILRSG